MEVSRKVLDESHDGFYDDGICGVNNFELKLGPTTLMNLIFNKLYHGQLFGSFGFTSLS
jgi:hypothetical protein